MFDCFFLHVTTLNNVFIFSTRSFISEITICFSFFICGYLLKLLMEQSQSCGKKVVVILQIENEKVCLLITPFLPFILFICLSHSSNMLIHHLITHYIFPQFLSVLIIIDLHITYLLSFVFILNIVIYLLFTLQ